MKRIFSLLFVALLAVGLLAGCGGSSKDDAKDRNTNAAQTATAFPVTIKDALDNNVEIKEKPNKIVSLIPSNTEIAYALGLGKEIVGVSDYDNYPKDALTKEKIGGEQFNTEKIIGLKPDLVLAHASTATSAKDALQQLRDAGITVLVIPDAQSFDQVYNTIEMIGKATGTAKKADDLIKDMKNQLASIKEKASRIKEKKKVYIEVAPAPDIYTTGSQTFMDEMLAAINAENIEGDQQGWIKVDQESVIQKNPDVIITTYGDYVKDATKQVLSRKGWENVNAIKNKQVIDVNADLVTRSGPRIIEGVEELAKAIYPEVFK